MEPCRNGATHRFHTPAAMGGPGSDFLIRQESHLAHWLVVFVPVGVPAGTNSRLPPLLQSAITIPEDASTIVFTPSSSCPRRRESRLHQIPCHPREGGGCAGMTVNQRLGARTNLFCWVVCVGLTFYHADAHRWHPHRSGATRKGCWVNEVVGAAIASSLAG